MESETETSRASLSELGFEALLALATLTLWPILDERAIGTAEQRCRALVFTPIIGFAEGVALGLIDRGLSPWLGAGTRSLVVIATAALVMLFLPWRGVADTVAALRAGSRPASTGLARIGPTGAAAAITAFVI